MTRNPLLTTKLMRAISRDWLTELPPLGEYSPQELLRCVGPLLVGVCFDRDSSRDNYSPLFHVHCLAIASDILCLQLWTPLRSERSGCPVRIRTGDHAVAYQAAATALKRRALLPLGVDLTLAQVLDAYRQHMSDTEDVGSPRLFLEMASICAWADKPEMTLQLMEECLGHDQDEDLYQHVGGRERFEHQCREAAAHPEQVRALVEQQVAALRADKLPVSRLIV